MDCFFDRITVTCLSAACFSLQVVTTIITVIIKTVFEIITDDDPDNK